jgi:hypothetical protein
MRTFTIDRDATIDLRRQARLKTADEPPPILHPNMAHRLPLQNPAPDRAVGNPAMMLAAAENIKAGIG